MDYAQKKVVLIVFVMLFVFSAGQLAITAFSVFDSYASSGGIGISITIAPTFIYTNYTDQGTTTNITQYNRTQLKNLSNLIIEKPAEGIISWIDKVNLLDSEDKDKAAINLDKHTNISYNFVFVNSTAFPGLDKAATIVLKNLTFTNPRVVRDNSVCLSNICTINQYINGTLSFNVTQFSSYYAEEIPAAVEEEEVVPAQLGGGGARPKSVKDLPKEKPKQEEEIVLAPPEEVEEEIVKPDFLPAYIVLAVIIILIAYQIYLRRKRKK